MARTRKAGKPWTGAEDKIIVKLVKQGVPTRKMASQLGRTPGAIRSHASQAGISLVVAKRIAARRMVARRMLARSR